jgi:hypothetical protein
VPLVVICTKKYPPGAIVAAGVATDVRLVRVHVDPVDVATCSDHVESATLVVPRL